MQKLGVWEERWTSMDDVNFTVMDSVKNVIAKKNKNIFDQISQDFNYKGPKSAA